MFIPFQIDPVTSLQTLRREITLNEIQKIKELYKNSLEQNLAVERVQMLIREFRNEKVNVADLQNMMEAAVDESPSPPPTQQEERAETLRQVNAFFQRFDHPMSSETISLSKIRDMISRTEPLVTSLAQSSDLIKQPLVRQFKALNTIVPSEPVREVVRATRFTSYRIAKSTTSETTRLFMLMVNLF